MIATCSGKYRDAAMMIMLRTRKRNESAEIDQWKVTRKVGARKRSKECEKDDGRVRTEYELLRRRKHVEREGNFVLVTFELEPSEKGGGVKGHCAETRSASYSMLFRCIRRDIGLWYSIRVLKSDGNVR